MAAIDYVVRDGVGRLVRGTVGEFGANNVIVVDTSSEVSLNLARADISDYRRIGNTLEVYLADGRVLVLEGFFSEVKVTDSRLYLSSNNELVEITFSESWGRTNYAHYDGEVSTAAQGELTFDTASGVLVETETTMAAVPIFLGGGFGGAAAGVAGLAGAAALASGVGSSDDGDAGNDGTDDGDDADDGDGNSDGDNGGTTTVTVIPDSVSGGDVTLNADATDLVVSGTTQPGTVVIVRVGDAEGTATAGDDGTWSVTIPADELPTEGTHGTEVIFEHPAGDETLDGPEVTIDVTAPDASFTVGVVSVGDVIGDDEHEGGVGLSGLGEPGAAISIEINGDTRTAVVQPDGTWTVTIPSSMLPEGEYTVPVTLTTTDAAGNSAVVNDTIRVDTVADPLELDAAAIAVDDVINDVENEDGVTVSGTAAANADITLTLAGVTIETQSDADGNWTANFGPDALPPGEYDAELVATSTDGAGNVSTATAPVRVDTLGDVTVSTATVETDGVINAVESQDGVTLTGTTQPGSSVLVNFAGQNYDAVVDSVGNWSVNVPASGIPAGESTQTVTATATDAAGNVAVASGSVEIDTAIDVAFDQTQVGDNLITAQEAAAGIILTGTTDVGTSVTVELNGVIRTATVSSDGTWSASFSPSDLPDGLMTLPMTVTATDAAGNTATDSGNLGLDTLGFVRVGPTPVEGDNVVNFVEASDGVVVTGSTQPGSSVIVQFGDATVAAVVAADGTWTANFTAGQIPEDTGSAPIVATATSPSGNVASDSMTVEVDTIVDNFLITSGTPGGDGVLNAAEAAAGITLTGTTEVGSTVMVTLGGATREANVAADGSWSVNLSGSDIQSGEYTTTLEVTTTDPAGNTTAISESVVVDTAAGHLALSGAPIETDDIINEAEAADGVTVSGTADPGAQVEVTMGAVTKIVRADADGDWTAYYANSEIPGGTYTANITATTTDAAGNTTTVSDTVQVDTQLAFSAQSVEGDNRITGAEAADGVVVSGIVEVGSTVVVTIGNVTQQAVVNANGTWSAQFASGDIAEGEYVTSMQAVATDAAGNTSLITSSVQVDTAVENLAITSLPVGPGQVLNAQAAASGITLAGTVEQGSTVLVTMEGVSKLATVNADGTWTVTFGANEVPTGEYTADVSVLATDAFGNQDTVAGQFTVDTSAPDAPIIEAYVAGGSTVFGLYVDNAGDETSLSSVSAAGGVQEVDYSLPLGPNADPLFFNFDTPLSDGSDLIVTAEDDAGNSSSTLFVVENEQDPSVNLANAGLDGFQIEAVDLQYASDADLTLTADLVRSMSDNSDQLTIHGGDDDEVTMIGAMRTGQVQRIGDSDYDVYTLGDGDVSVIIDQDINVVI